MRKTQRQESLYRHITVEMREHDVIPLVEVLSSEDGLNALGAGRAVSSPANASLPVVQHIMRASGEPEVSEAVVVPDPIAVVDLCHWVLAIVQKPRKTVRHVQNVKNLDADVPVMVASAGNGAGFAGAATDLPRYLSRIRVVLEDIANFIWDNCKVHTVLPHVVDRGAVAVTTVAPILSRGEA